MNAWVGPAIVAAFIAGLVSAAGWFVSSRQSVQAEQRRRREKVRDVQTALLAEIRSVVHHLGQYDAAEIVSEVERRLATTDGYTPFVSREPGSPLYKAVAGEISILPNAVIDHVVLFYRQQEVIAHFAEDLRGERFIRAPGDQKASMIRDYLELRGYAALLGTDAIRALEGSLDEALSKRDEDRSDRRSASGAA